MSRKRAYPDDDSGLEELLRQSKFYSDVIGTTLEGYEEQHTQPKLIKGKLKDYQLEGLNWLISLYENGLNGILADEMGLGKTLQCIALLSFIYEVDNQGPFLIVTPLSTIDNWCNEFKKFAPKLPLTKYIGEQRKQPIDGRVVVTSYEIIMKDLKFLRKQQWKFLIVDEGHRLKNINCKLIQDLKCVRTTNRLLLTGTPLQNNLQELWSLLNFILPEFFYNELLDSEVDLTKLKSILKPFLLRRLKNRVLDLPPKTEYILYSKMTSQQEKFYQSETARKPSHLMMIQRQLANSTATLYGPHEQPESVQEVVNDSDSDIKILDTPSAEDSEIEEVAAKEIEHDDSYNLDFLLESSAKLQQMQQLVPELLANDHKILIFSQFLGTLDILQDWCDFNNIHHTRIDGTMDNDSRNDAIRNFKQIFLLSTRAGGLGLNLVKADTVIIFDSDWNPQVDIQAIDRAHRIGQTKPVHVYRMVSKDSVEQTIIDRAIEKRKLEYVLDGDTTSAVRHIEPSNGRRPNVLSAKMLKEFIHR